MIREIVNFVEYLEEKSPKIFSENINLKEGVYVFLEKEGDELVVKEENILKVDKKTIKRDFTGNDYKLYNDFLDRYTNVAPISSNKAFNRGIFGLTANPFALGFKMIHFLDKNKKNKAFIQKSIDEYFKNADKYVDEEIKANVKLFSEWLKNHLWEFLTSRLWKITQSGKLLAEMKEEYPKSELPETKSFPSIVFKVSTSNIKKYGDFMLTLSDNIISLLNKTASVYLFYLNDITDFNLPYEKYQSKKVFNKEEYNVTIGEDVYGISDDLSSFAVKKIFLKHQTAFFNLNYRINGNSVLKVKKFYDLLDNNILPNPAPIFVDKHELTESAIKFYVNNRKAGHKEIIEYLIKKHVPDLHNYYLIYHKIVPKKGRKIIDLDFVPVFRYKTDDMPVVKAVFNVTIKDRGDLIHDFTIKNIFEFQDKILNFVFNKQLITETKNGLWIKYFDDLEVDTKFNMATETIVNLFYKYRRAFYDYVYKSRRQAITGIMFYDIMSNSILDDVRHDEYKLEKKYHTKEKSIKEKLNIWFSFYNYFNNNKKPENMVNKTEQLFERLKQIAQNDNERIRSDEEFAFAAGQLIRTILNKSESGERSHALLEPFLQKTNPGQFKLAIAREFEKYKHAFKFYKGDKNRYEFDKIMSEVMGVETNTSIKTLLPLILAGYFSETIFKKDEEQN